MLSKTSLSETVTLTKAFNLRSHFFTRFLTIKHGVPTDFHVLFASLLSQLPGQNSSEIASNSRLMAHIKRAVFNHSLNLYELHTLLASELSHAETFSSPLIVLLQDVFQAIPEYQAHLVARNPLRPLAIDDLDLRFGRHLESNLVVNLLKNPPNELQQIIKKISIDILLSINYHRQVLLAPQLNALYSSFLFDLGGSASNPERPNLPLAFGRFLAEPSLDDVVHVLEEDKNMIRTLLIQFMFMRNVFPFAPGLKNRNRKIIKQAHEGDFAKFIEVNTKDNPDGTFLRAKLHYFFMHYVYFSPHLYTDRGRLQFIDKTSRHLGIMLKDEDRVTYPVEEAPWYPDCLCNKPDLASKYVRMLTRHDIPYVAGPSGMTSIFSGLITYYGDLNKEEKEIYSLAITAFIAGGGLHSIHEILTVIHIRIGLLEMYRPHGVNQGNYGDYFQHFIPRIPALADLVDDAWQASLGWFKTQHEPQCNPSYYHEAHRPPRNPAN